MNNDVLTEVLLHLPVQCLLRFRAVCKFWRHIIDSPLFQKLHNHNNNCNKSEDTVFLQVIFSDNGIRVQHNRQSLISYKTAHFNDFHGPVNGLICFNNSYRRGPIAICNPVLGQFTNLPSFTPSSNSLCQISKRSAAVGYDEDYKVVQLLECKTHYSLHAHVYSRKTGAWKELAGDARVVLDNMQLYPDVSPMKSACKNGYFAHWRVYGSTMRCVHGLFYNSLILSFDMRNEVFQTVNDYGASYGNTRYFAEDEHSFLRFDFDSTNGKLMVPIYKSSLERRKLSWNHVMNVEVPKLEIPPRWSNGCVFFELSMVVFVYDYRARKFICVMDKKTYHCRSILMKRRFLSIEGALFL